MYALLYCYRDDDGYETDVLAVSEDLNKLKTHAHNDAMGKGCDELSDFSQFQTTAGQSIYLAYVKFMKRSAWAYEEGGKYFIEPVDVIK